MPCTVYWLVQAEQDRDAIVEHIAINLQNALAALEHPSSTVNDVSP